MLYGLLSKLSVPGNVNSLNNYAEAPEINLPKGGSGALYGRSDRRET